MQEGRGEPFNDILFHQEVHWASSRQRAFCEDIIDRLTKRREWVLEVQVQMLAINDDNNNNNSYMFPVRS
jgi:hypothetical protein